MLIPPGMCNYANICYVNNTLQCLFNQQLSFDTFMKFSDYGNHYHKTMGNQFSCNSDFTGGLMIYTIAIISRIYTFMQALLVLYQP